MQRQYIGRFVMLGLMCITAQCSPSSQRSNETNRTQFIEAHGNDPEALDKEYGSEAQAACDARANDYLRSIARHDFSWDKDAEGFLGTKFDKIITKSTGLGMLTLKSSKAKLSNGYGAFEHVDIYCLYNVASKEFVRFSTYDPLLDVLESERMQQEGTPPAAKDLS